MYIHDDVKGNKRGQHHMIVRSFLNPTQIKHGRNDLSAMAPTSNSCKVTFSKGYKMKNYKSC